MKIEEKAPLTTSSWWQHSSIGYIAACLGVAAAVGVTLLESVFIPHAYFSVSSLLLAILLVSLFRGVGPGILASLLSCAAFSYFAFRSLYEPNIPPLSWLFLVRFIPFAIACLAIAIIAGLHERVHRVLQQRADELSIMNQELKQANLHKDQFVTRAAHELRTPLTTILGETQFAMRRLNKIKEPTAESLLWEKHIERIEVGAWGLKALVEELIDLSSFRSGEIRLRLSPCDFEDLCSKVVKDLRTVSRHYLEFESSSIPIILDADSEQLSRVVINIVRNAILYALDDTSIHIRLSTEHSHVMLRVHNDAPALSHEQQKHLFEPFYRTPYAEAMFREGWGLGLTMSKEIVERHGGYIWVESSEGKGVTCFVLIPLKR